jgi:hypothetical protein
MQAPRLGHGAIKLPDGRVVVVGGRSNGAGATLLNTAEIFTPQ